MDSERGDEWVTSDSARAAVKTQRGAQTTCGQSLRPLLLFTNLNHTRELLFKPPLKSKTPQKKSKERLTCWNSTRASSSFNRWMKTHLGVDRSLDLFIQLWSGKPSVCVTVSVFVRCCFLWASRRSEITGFLTSVFTRKASGRSTGRHEAEFTETSQGGGVSVWWRVRRLYCEGFTELDMRIR